MNHPLSLKSNPPNNLNLAHDHDLEALITRLTAVFSHKDQYRQLLTLRDFHARKLLDLFQGLLDTPGVDASFRRALIVATQRLSNTCGLYPTCYELKDVQCLGDPVAAGGFADVYKGSFRGKAVSIKVIRVYQTSRVEYFLKRCAKEAILWGQLSHPNILSIFGLYRLQSKICLISPWMDHGDLNDYLQNQQNVDRRLLASDAAQGLLYLHSNGVIHGDLKAANILVSSSGRAHLADFGLSSVSDANILAWTSHSSVASKGGSARWQAPELFDFNLDEAVANTTASDIYALACVWYEIFAGVIPFHNIPLDVAVMFQVKSGAKPSRPLETSESWGSWGLTEPIWNLMARCWNTVPTERPIILDIATTLAPYVGPDLRPEIKVDLPSSRQFREEMGARLDAISVDELEKLIGIHPISMPVCEENDTPETIRGLGYHVEGSAAAMKAGVFDARASSSNFGSSGNTMGTRQTPGEVSKGNAKTFREVPDIDWGNFQSYVAERSIIATRNALKFTKDNVTEKTTQKSVKSRTTKLSARTYETPEGWHAETSIPSIQCRKVVDFDISDKPAQLSAIGGTAELLLFGNFDPEFSRFRTSKNGKCYNIVTCFPYNPMREIHDDGPTRMVEIFSTPLLALVDNESDPYRLRIMNINHSSMVCELCFPSKILAAKLNREAIIVVLGGMIHVYNLSDMVLLKSIKFDSKPEAIALSPSAVRPYLAFPQMDAQQGRVTLFSIGSRTTVGFIQAHETPVSCLSFNSTGTLLATASEASATVHVWSVPAIELLHEFRYGRFEAQIYSMNFNFASTLLVVASSRDMAHLFKLDSITRYARAVNTLTQTALGRHLPSLLADKTVNCFGYLFLPMQGARYHVVCDESYVMVTSIEGTQYVYSIDKEQGGECFRSAISYPRKELARETTRK